MHRLRLSLTLLLVLALPTQALAGWAASGCQRDLPASQAAAHAEHATAGQATPCADMSDMGQADCCQQDCDCVQPGACTVVHPALVFSHGSGFSAAAEIRQLPRHQGRRLAAHQHPPDRPPIALLS